MPYATYIETHRTELVAFLRQLVAVPTVNPPGERYGEIVALLEAKCRSLGMGTRVWRVPDEDARLFVPDPAEHPRFNLIAEWNVGAARTIHFNSHYDVVPVSGGWNRDPFDAHEADGWLYGRGSDDMKDSIAATLFAVQALRATGTVPACNLVCSFTADEETGGDLGAGWIAKNGLIEADAVVNCEGGTGENVGCGHNGVLWLEATVKGKAAHASRPADGLNAFEKMSELVLTLQALKPRLAAPERVFVTPSGAERFPTINLGGVFFGTLGDKVNTVPAQATFSIDRRIVPTESVASAERELRAAIDAAAASIPDLNVEVRRTLAIEPCQVDESDPFVRAFGKAAETIRGGAVGYSLTTGFTDLHFLVEGGKRPGVGYGPKGENAHGADERVDLDDLTTVAKIYAEFMARGEW